MVRAPLVRAPQASATNLTWFMKECCPARSRLVTEGFKLRPCSLLNDAIETMSERELVQELKDCSCASINKTDLSITQESIICKLWLTYYIFV